MFTKKTIGRTVRKAFVCWNVERQHDCRPLVAVFSAGLNASATVATAEAWCLWGGRCLTRDQQLVNWKMLIREFDF